MIIPTKLKLLKLGKSIFKKKFEIWLVKNKVS